MNVFQIKVSLNIKSLLFRENLLLFFFFPIIYSYIFFDDTVTLIIMISTSTVKIVNLSHKRISLLYKNKIFFKFDIDHSKNTHLHLYLNYTTSKFFTQILKKKKKKKKKRSGAKDLPARLFT